MDRHEALRLLSGGGRRLRSTNGPTLRIVENTQAARTKQVDESAEGLAHARHLLGIRVKGSDIPGLLFDFHGLSVLFDDRPTMKNILKVVEESEYMEPTAVQMQCIPALLKGRDMIVGAPTGSGKTAAFAIPAVLKAAQNRKVFRGPTVAVITPTRELATQTVRYCQKFCRDVDMVASTSMSVRQKGDKIECKDNVETGCKCDILVSTPLRLVKELEGHPSLLSNVALVVLDEADRLLDMGFQTQVDAILASVSRSAQKTFFSATIPPVIEELGRSVMMDPLTVFVGQRNGANIHIRQELKYCGSEQGKLLEIRRLVKKGFSIPAIVFVQSKDRVKQLYRELACESVKVDVIHSDLTQEERDDVMRRLRTGKVWMLLCTDLIARGVDFKGVKLVINYDFPQSAASYIHRIGRTGRAGMKGHAITYFADEDIDFLRTIANVVRQSGCDVPEWMLQLKSVQRSQRKKLEYRPPKRKAISTAPSKQSDHKRRKESSNHGGTKYAGNNTPQQGR